MAHPSVPLSKPAVGHCASWPAHPNANGALIDAREEVLKRSSSIFTRVRCRGGVTRTSSVWLSVRPILNHFVPHRSRCPHLKLSQRSCRISASPTMAPLVSQTGADASVGPVSITAIARGSFRRPSNGPTSTNAERDAFKILVGVKPNGLAFDPDRGILIAANVGDPAIANSYTVSVVDIARRERIAEIEVPGRTRWAIYDPSRAMFFVNIASPAHIVAIDARDPTKIAKTFHVPAAGPHGLDFDPTTGRLLCACDAGVLVVLDGVSGRVLGEVPLSGTPDVIFLHPESARLYVAIGDPGVIDVVDIGAMRRLEVVLTEKGAHTLALDRKRRKIYAFLPRSHRAAVFVDTD